MSMLSRIDEWLIEGPYQAVVDLSQRKPEWWARQSLVLTMVMSCIRSSFFSSEDQALRYTMLALCAVVLGAIWLTTISPVLFFLTGKLSWARVFLFVATLSRLLSFLLGSDAVRCIATLLCDVAFMSFYYFAACKPPRPRVPRTRLAPGGAA